jgi:hypothetical protein
MVEVPPGGATPDVSELREEGSRRRRPMVALI